MDFFKVKERHTKKEGVTEIYPDFIVRPSKDLMTRGRAFYAIWDEGAGLWSTNEFDVQRFVDDELRAYVSSKYGEEDASVSVKWMSSSTSNSWVNFKKYVSNLPDNYHQLDGRLIFQGEEVRKEDYASHVLPYALTDSECPSYEELISTLYDPEERAKLEWAIGSIIKGDSRHIDKFIVLYGDAGSGKSTVLKIVSWLFDGYYTNFDAKALGISSKSFSMEAFKSGPLVAIQHDGDLSKIEDNTRLNSIVSHEEMEMNEKFKSAYTIKVEAFLFVASNQPVKITDSKSGIIRRLIDVSPSGRRFPPSRYSTLMSRIRFELGGIAKHCLDVYESMGENYYSGYKPWTMMYKTDVFFNFVENYMDIFMKEDGVSLKQAYSMYKDYCNEALISRPMPMYSFREELKDYFKEFQAVARVDDRQVRSWYSGFIAEKFMDDSEPEGVTMEVVRPVSWLSLESDRSLLDDVLKDCKAQYASKEETPSRKWENVRTTLKDIDTTRLHYVLPPENMIVVDFDIKDETGQKSRELNVQAAEKWPETYAEFSKGGGLHLHYWFEGSVSQLAPLYGPGVEVKTFSGKSSLRRRLSLCNDIPVATLSAGLPLKEKKMLDKEVAVSERSLVRLINKNLRKEIHPSTKQSVNYICHLLDEAYESGVHYDVRHMYPKIVTFASKSSHNAKYCLDMVAKAHFYSEDIAENKDKDGEIVIFDIEVFPNLFLVVWKYLNKDMECVRMINPSPREISDFIFSGVRLVGFNNRRYDNHILYGRYLGKTNKELYQMSQAIVSGNTNALIGNAYSISYADVYDFCSVKQSLKKWEIELGIHHQELGMKWDEPVPEDKWTLVAEYCDNDVLATEAVFNHCQEDFVARQILSDLSGLPVNDGTQSHVAKILFGDDKYPQGKFVYTDLTEMFPSYVFENGKSFYKGYEVGEGGFVYAEPGIYHNVALIDVKSMHPTSLILLNYFGPYTKRFEEIVKARLYIKAGDHESAKKLLNGELAKYLDSGEYSDKALAFAFKMIINPVYGYTMGGYPNNKFRDPRNVDNIIAKRGALFMIDLMEAVKEKGYTVAHIKTDSIKIPNADPEIIQFVMDFGAKYGYSFDHEATYSSMCLVNDAVYIAKYADPEGKGEWTATGAQFKVPYVFKTLFSKEPITFDDCCETRSVQSAMYLDLNENLGEGEHDYRFIGRAGRFTPVLPGNNGGLLMREKGGKYYAVTGTTGYRWLESESMKALGLEDQIDYSYYNNLVEAAKKTIEKFGDPEVFIEDYEIPF